MDGGGHMGVLNLRIGAAGGRGELDLVVLGRCVRGK